MSCGPRRMAPPTNSRRGGRSRRRTRRGSVRAAEVHGEDVHRGPVEILAADPAELRAAFRELAQRELRDAPEPPFPDRLRGFGGAVDRALRLQVDRVAPVGEDRVAPHRGRAVALDALVAKRAPPAGDIQDQRLLPALGRGLLGVPALVDRQEILRADPHDADLAHGLERRRPAHGRDGPVEDELRRGVERRGGHARCGRERREKNETSVPEGHGSVRHGSSCRQSTRDTEARAPGFSSWRSGESALASSRSSPPRDRSGDGARIESRSAKRRSRRAG